MILTVTVGLLVSAFITCIMAFIGKCPVPIPVLLVILAVAIQFLPK